MATFERRGGVHGWVRRLLWGIGGAAALLLVTYGVVATLASRKEREATAAWRAAGLPIDDYLESFPSRAATPEEAAIEAAAQRLGLSLEKSNQGAPSPETRAWEAVSGPVRAYGSQGVESPSASCPPPPEEVAAFLARHAETLAELRTRLQTTAPIWKMEPEKGYEAEVPRLMGHIELTRLFIADALAAHAAGQDAAALADLEAVWHLSEGIERRPEIISQLVTLAMRKMAVVVLRKLDGVGPEWGERIGGWDPRPGLLNSFRGEGEVMGMLARAPGPLGEAYTMPAWIGSLPGRPYLRLCAADTQLWLLRHVETVRSSDPCDPDPAVPAASDAASPGIPSWNIIASVALPNLSNAWLRTKYYTVQVELTERVLAAKRARSADGTWPATVEGIDRPLCPDQHWSYAVSPEGEMTLSYSLPMPDGKTIKGNFPHEFRQK